MLPSRRRNFHDSPPSALQRLVVVLLGLLWPSLVGAQGSLAPPATARAAPTQPATGLPPTTFVDVTERTGITFRNVCGGPSKDWILEVNGSGVALFDHDRDGDLDVYFVNGARVDPAPSDPRPRNELWRNDGGWRFADVTEESGTGDEGWGSGASVADLDNDGLLDIYVSNWGPNVVYRNRGDGSFERVERSGAEDPLWSMSAALADFDRDGLVDIYVANYVDFRFDAKTKRGAPQCVYKGVPIFCGPGGLIASPDSLFINLGDCRFRDASEEWGVRKVEPAFGMGSLVVDIQRDGYPDVLVANDTDKNFCFLNGRGKGFSEASMFLGLAYNDYGVEQASMGLAAGDTRGLGRDDIFVTNYEDDTNSLYLAEEGGFYTDATDPARLGTTSYRYMGWGTFFFDADGDGDVDLFVSNGHLAPQMEGQRNSIGYTQDAHLYLNDGTAQFSLCPECLPGGRKKSTRGAAHGDLDGDGDPDIVVNAIDDAPILLENRASARWVEVRLRGTRSNRAAIGARVSLTVAGRYQERTLRSGTSYASQCELAARFGLGFQAGSGGGKGVKAPEAEIGRIRVDWPSGLIEEFPPPRPGDRLLLVEGEGVETRRTTE